MIAAQRACQPFYCPPSDFPLGFGCRLKGCWLTRCFTHFLFRIEKDRRHHAGSPERIWEGYEQHTLCQVPGLWKEPWEMWLAVDAKCNYSIMKSHYRCFFNYLSIYLRLMLVFRIVLSHFYGYIYKTRNGFMLAVLFKHAV